MNASRPPRPHRVARPVSAALAFASAGLAVMWPATGHAQEAIDEEAIMQFSEMIRWSGVATSLFVIFGAWMLLRFLQRVVDGLGRQFADRRLLLQKAATIVQFFVYMGTIGAVILLSFKLDDKVLAVIGGTVAVSVGFAVKDLVASVIAGVMIMLDRPFQVGDRVLFAGEYGDITSIGLRSVRMQTLDDNTVTIPNNKFLNEVTSCGNYGALDMQVVMDFHVAVGEDLERARDIVQEAALTSRYVFLPKPVVVLVTEVPFDCFIAKRLRLKAYVLDTKYEKALESDVHLRVAAAFRREGISPPAILTRSLDTPAGRSGAPAIPALGGTPRA